MAKEDLYENPSDRVVRLFAEETVDYLQRTGRTGKTNKQGEIAKLCEDIIVAYDSSHHAVLETEKINPDEVCSLLEAALDEFLRKVTQLNGKLVSAEEKANLPSRKKLATALIDTKSIQENITVKGFADRVTKRVSALIDKISAHEDAVLIQPLKKQYSDFYRALLQGATETDKNTKGRRDMAGIESELIDVVRDALNTLMMASNPDLFPAAADVTLFIQQHHVLDRDPNIRESSKPLRNKSSKPSKKDGQETSIYVVINRTAKSLTSMELRDIPPHKEPSAVPENRFEAELTETLIQELISKFVPRGLDGKEHEVAIKKAMSDAKAIAVEMAKMDDFQLDANGRLSTKDFRTINAFLFNFYDEVREHLFDKEKISATLTQLADVIRNLNERWPTIDQPDSWAAQNKPRGDHHDKPDNPDDIPGMHGF